MHLLFDLDGTLTNPELGITTCIRHALHQLGQPVPEASALAGWIGPPLHDSLAAVLDGVDQVTQAIALYRDRFATIGLYENEMYEGILAMLRELEQAPYTIWICTSKPQVFAQKIVDHFQLSGFFRGIYGSELNGDRAHKAELIAHLLAQEGIAPEQAIMIGDRHHDIDGARHNGLTALGVTWGFGTAAELTAAGAHALCHTPPQLVEELRSTYTW